MHVEPPKRPPNALDACVPDANYADQRRAANFSAGTAYIGVCSTICPEFNTVWAVSQGFRGP